MKLFLAALILSGLQIFGLSCGTANTQQPQATPTPESGVPQVVEGSVTLTSEHPTGSFAVYPDLTNPPTLLEASVTKVVNPGSKPVTVSVYLTPTNEKVEKPVKLAVGNFSLYPVDRPAKFMLNPVPAWRKAAETKRLSDVKEWFVIFELKQEPDRGSAPLEVTIGQPHWKRDKD